MKISVSLKRSFTAIILLFITWTFLSSCKKETSNIENEQANFIEPQIKNKVSDWLKKQKDSAASTAKTKIQLLQDNLDFLHVRSGTLSPDEEIIVIPIKNSYTTSINIEKNPLNSLILFTNKNKEIRWGNIIQYISLKKISNSEDLANFFFQYYNLKAPDFTGTLACNTISDEVKYEINYTNGKLKYYKSIHKKQGSGITETCWEFGWYYYWADGSVTFEPLGTFCDGCEPVKHVNGKSYRLANGCGGGGGGNGGEPPMATQRELSWEVYSEYGINGNPTLIGQVQVWGVKISGEPQGGHFTDIHDHDGYLLNFVQYQMSIGGAFSQAWIGPQHAHQDHQGNVIYAPYTAPPKYYDKHKTWDFIEVFP